MFKKRKTIKKYILMIIISLLCAVSFNPVAYAYTQEKAIDQPEQDYSFLGDVLDEFYEGGDSVYEITNKDGELSNIQFLEDTKLFFLKRQWSEIGDYLNTNHLSIRKTSYSKDTTRALDIALTKTESFVKNLYSSDDKFNVIVICELRGTIFYDPNTYIISHVSTPIATEISFSSPSVRYKNLSLYSSKISNYTGKFNVSFDVYNDVPISPIEYGNFSDSFTITAE